MLEHGKGLFWGRKEKKQKKDCISIVFVGNILQTGNSHFTLYYYYNIMFA